MDTGKIREGPDTREEGPWPPAKVTTTPDRRDAKPQAAFIYDKELAVEAQTRTAQRSRAASRSRSYAGGGSRRRSQVGGEAAIPSAGVKFDGHWISLEDGRRVRLVLNGSYDSRRVSWVRPADPVKTLLMSLTTLTAWRARDSRPVRWHRRVLQVLPFLSD